ncbi:hypothetical protein BHF71_09590 [Vulcanibacillus modesticaldus]|uniref:DUF302 domain-containing protein n=1 Tax=Vulcanibacillus modesticaldus TaxID=337097 RepID=A0A1D2YU56_9BACI|nr:DUF302 domain-containing protein [Vulcanibacillus modesticaldus]OEF99234.1 hypothetical protein BHF71_09590 [Vulcanibacillus modesticaldus]
MYHYTKSTTKSEQEVIESLEKAIKENEFGLLWKFEIHKKLEEKGLPYNQNITVFEVCNPKAASNVLEIDPMVSYFLPCKIVVIADDNEVKVGFVKPSVLIGLTENDKMDELVATIEAKLVNTIDQAIK